MKNFNYSVIAIIFAYLLSACNSHSEYSLLKSDQNLSKNNSEMTQTIDYRILPHDRIQVSLYTNPEIVASGSSKSNTISNQIQEGGMLVSPEGYIVLPLINKVKVAGLTQSQAAERITERYRTYLKIPLVYLEVLNKRVYVIGEVKKPGPVTIDREKMSLLEALAFVGDMTDNAVRDNIIIVSHNAINNQMTMRSVDLVHFDRLSIANMMLKPNDIIYVQPDGWKEYKVGADNIAAPFATIAQLASPFVTLKYLSN